MDFLKVNSQDFPKRGVSEISPSFKVIAPKDLIIKGGDFYAVYIPEKTLWSTNEQDLFAMIDKELDACAEKHKKEHPDYAVKVKYMWDGDSRMVNKFRDYCKNQSRDSGVQLDSKVIFSNHELKREDYASKVLPYPLEEGDISAYEELMNTLYSPEERHKIEWAIGSIVNGDSKRIQKFLVLYGAAGTGKSTVLNIIQQLFEGYYTVFDAKALGSSNNEFALEAFKTNPLVAIQHDGDLSHIEDNTRLNSVVSHEEMIVNVKFKSAYPQKFQCFLFMGTNKPVKITDARSGLIRRLIDVQPTGNTLKSSRYKAIMKQIGFELGAIAYHCKQVYEEDPGYYDNYIPLAMIGASNDFYNFMLDSFFKFQKDNETTLKVAWEMYKAYNEEAKVPYPYTQRVFKEELKNYFYDYQERHTADDNSRIRSYYSGFRVDKFKEFAEENTEKEPNDISWLSFKEQESLFDSYFKDTPAQYANEQEHPCQAWDKTTTKLSDLDTRKLHYVNLDDNVVVIDFDIRNEKGDKDYERNYAEASKWPPTYAELSKSGGGIHLHYIYNGDTSKLSHIYSKDIEVKTFSGGSSLRRKLTKCNDISIATLSSGLPEKETKSKMVEFKQVEDDIHLHNKIRKYIRKESFPSTAQSINAIYDELEAAYKAGFSYDISDLKPEIIAFAAQSTHQSKNCLKKVTEMKFTSADILEQSMKTTNNFNNYQDVYFYDCEVFPNLFVVVVKKRGKDAKPKVYINPSQEDIVYILSLPLIGFNCRKYDNHIQHGALIGYSCKELFDLSVNMIQNKKGFFGVAYNYSLTDILDYCSKKQSLKKWEIELGKHHQEAGFAWDKDVPKESWNTIVEYCINDVMATEAVFEATQPDFLARCILAEITGKTINDTTNTLTQTWIFEDNKNPQSCFNYRFMGDMRKDDTFVEGFDEYTRFNSEGKPVFPGYIFENGVSTYREEIVGEGGYVYAEPGIHTNVALLDIASMHPSSIVAEDLFGKYTRRFKDILDMRIAIKHKDYDRAKTMFDGKLEKYLSDKDSAKTLSGALKIAINSVYGLTSASFENPFRDIRNVDNIVAKRGALFMINLKHEVQKRGFTVAHIKTDSIKIPNATPDIINFVVEYGKMYGYNFEHECTYDRMCLVNDAVYISKNCTVERCEELYGTEYVNSSNDICKENKEEPGAWSATGKQFQVPYVFKTLFSHEPIELRDLAETKEVKKGDLYLDMNETLGPDEHNYVFVGHVGLFCPIKPGCGGGELYRIDREKPFAATGTKGYRWLETEVVESCGKQDDIDISYYAKLVDDAIESIAEFGDAEMFIGD